MFPLVGAMATDFTVGDELPQAARKAAHPNANPDSAKRLGLLIMTPPQSSCRNATRHKHPAYGDHLVRDGATSAGEAPTPFHVLDPKTPLQGERYLNTHRSAKCHLRYGLRFD